LYFSKPEEKKRLFLKSVVFLIYLRIENNEINLRNNERFPIESK